MSHGSHVRLGGPILKPWPRKRGKNHHQTSNISHNSHESHEYGHLRSSKQGRMRNLKDLRSIIPYYTYIAIHHLSIIYPHLSSNTIISIIQFHPSIPGHLFFGPRSWVICGAAVSCLGQQLSEMAEAAFQLQGADVG